MSKTKILMAVFVAFHIICSAKNIPESEYIYATDIDGVRIDTRDGMSENKTRSLLIDAGDRLVVATSAGIDIFDGTGFLTIPATPEEGEKLLTRTNTRRLREDRKLGILWLKTGILSTQKYSRLHAFDAASGSIVTEEALQNLGGPERPWTDFFIDETGNYWIIDSERNLHQKRDGKWHRTLNLDTFGKEEPWNLSVSPDGKSLYIMYGSGKVYSIDTTTPHVRTTYAGPEGYALRGRVRWDEGKMYFALSNDRTGTAIIVRHDPETESFTPFAKTDRALNDFIFDRKGKLIAAPIKGMPETMTFALDRTDGLWIGTHDNGLVYSNPGRQTRVEASPEPYAHRRSKEFCSSRAAEYASHYARDITNSSAEDPKSKTVYLATRKGIMAVDSLGKLRARIDHNSGLESDNVQAIVATDSAVWFTTSSSIGRLTIGKDYCGKLVSFGRLDGIELNGLEFKPGELRIDSAGMIVAGFPGGSYRIDPTKISTAGIPVYDIEPYPEKGSGNSSAILWISVAALFIAAGGAAAIKMRAPSPKQRKEPDTASIDELEAIGKKESESEGKEKVSAVRGEEKKTETMREIDISAMLCQPTGPDPDEVFKDKLYKSVDANMSDEEFNVQKLSELMAMDRSNLYRKTQSAMGMTPSEFIKERRLQVSKALLTESGLSITDISDRCGYSSVRYFSTVFKKECGVTPSEFRSGHTASSSDVTE